MTATISRRAGAGGSSPARRVALSFARSKLRTDLADRGWGLLLGLLLAGTWMTVADAAGWL